MNPPDHPDDIETPDDGDLEEVRRILFGAAADRIDDLEDRLDRAEVRTDEVAAVLPDAIQKEAGRGDRLGAALAPTVEEALHVSIRRNPHALAEAVSPIMGPAIRRSILQAISGMVQSLNSAMEQSFTPQGLRWRIEGWRTGRSFGEVVALRTLLFEVEEVFLIHRETALLLSHRSVRGSADADVVGSMLVAIRDFVKDSFQSGEGGTLDTIQVGEKTVWIENGRDTVLAAVIRGQAPAELRPTIAGVLDEIEVRYGQALESFEGDDAPFENVATDHLADCMVAQARDGAPAGEAKQASPIARLAWVAVLALLLTWWGLSIRDGMRWDRLVEALDDEPGIVVVGTGKADGRRVLNGLRDPLAVDPDVVLAASPLDSSDVRFALEGYQSLDPEIVLRRVGAVLEPAADVSIELEGGRLRVQGTPSAEWLRRARQTASAMGGVDGVDLAGQVREHVALGSVVAELTDMSVLFAPGSAVLPGGLASVAPLAGPLTRANEVASGLAAPVVVEVIGSTDPTGAVERNRELAMLRARAVQTALGAGSYPNLRFVPQAAPVVTGAEDGGSEEDRSVRLVLRIPDA